MSAELPEGITLDFVRHQAATLSLTADLINLTSAHLSAEAGSPEEADAEERIEQWWSVFVDVSDDVSTGVVGTLATLVVMHAAEEDVQGFFDQNGAKIREALGHG